MRPGPTWPGSAPTCRPPVSASSDPGRSTVDTTVVLLGPAEVRRLAAGLGLRPTKTLGQNFVHDPNTVRRIVRAAQVSADDGVVEVGPGLGALTLALLPAAGYVPAVEIDPPLAAQLPSTVEQYGGGYGSRLRVHRADALTV